MDLEEIVKEIRDADGTQIDILLDEVFYRKRTLYPQWDLSYLALPKNDWVERRRILETILRMESEMQEEFLEKNIDIK